MKTAIPAIPVVYEVGQCRVEARGQGWWVVTNGGAVLNKDGQWEYEPLPSSRTDEFLARTRFTLSEAVKEARGIQTHDQGPNTGGPAGA